MRKNLPPSGRQDAEELIPYIIQRIRRVARTSWRRVRSKPRLAVAILASIPAIVALAAVMAFLTPDCSGEECPSMSELDGYRPPEPAHVYDRDGHLAGHLEGSRRIVLDLEEIPPLLREGFVAVEDRRFYEHGGVDLRSVARALRRNVMSGRRDEGASTITMQLARNIFAEEILDYSPWHRKATEARLAVEMESRLTKEQILELYLNQIYLGGGSYGVGAASRHLFDKELDELALSETALLVGLAKNPEGYNPRNHPGAALARRNLILDVLVREGVVDPDDALEAKTAEIEVPPPTLVWANGSYFAAAVRRELVEILPDPALRSGVKVFTGLDPDLQADAERAMIAQIERIENGALGSFDHPTPGKESASARIDASPYLQGMVVALDSRTGQVRALVGGRDFRASEFDRAFQAQRQPGSAFKPVILTAALSRRRPLTDLVRVDSLSLHDPNRPEDEDSIWSVVDTNPGDEPGATTITIRDALTRSSNAAAVRLGMQTGIENVISEARALGIASGIPPYPAIFLGTAEVVPAELVAAYAAFENGGQRVEPHLISRVESPDGEILWEAPPAPVQALDPRVAFLVRSVLEDVVDTGTGWRVRSSGLTGPAAGKTGTTNAGRDVWFVGMRPGIVAGVWLGFDRPRSIVPSASGGALAAPIWAEIMEGRSETDPPRGLAGGTDASAGVGPVRWASTGTGRMPWARPAGLVELEIDGSTGYLATSDCPGETVRSEFFLPGTEPRVYCPLHGRDVFDRIVDGVRGLFRGTDDRSRQTLEMAPR